MSGPLKLNLTEIDAIMGGADRFIVEVYGRVGSCVTRESIGVKHADSHYRGRMQLNLVDTRGRETIQVNMWGFEDKNTLGIEQNDMLLVTGARVNTKYGEP